MVLRVAGGRLVAKVGKSYPGQEEPHRDVEQAINDDRD